MGKRPSAPHLPGMFAKLAQPTLRFVLAQSSFVLGEFMLIRGQTDQQSLDVYALHDQGWSERNIAERLGMSRGAVRYALERRPADLGRFVPCRVCQVPTNLCIRESEGSPQIPVCSVECGTEIEHRFGWDPVQ